MSDVLWVRTFYDAKRMREEVNTEQGTANKKSEIPSFYEARKKKKESCQIFCAAVAQRYLLVHARITFASGKISPPKGCHEFNTKNRKWKIKPHQTRHGSTVQKSAPREAVPQRPPESTDRLDGTYRKHDNGDGGLAWKSSIAMRRSYHCPCSMMTERMPP